MSIKYRDCNFFFLLECNGIRYHVHLLKVIFFFFFFPVPHPSHVVVANFIASFSPYFLCDLFQSEAGSSCTPFFVIT